VVDTTGAGDAFAATLLAALHAGWPPDADALRAALARAAGAASAVARAIGAQAPIDGEMVPGR
jgi:sugar/nucleoside kinase (ribokinase family)